VAPALGAPSPDLAGPGAPGTQYDPGNTAGGATADDRNTRAVPNVIPVEYTVEDMRSKYTLFWVLYGPGLLLCLPYLAGIVFHFILLYRYWRICRDAHARTSPGEAVGFCFIPFFNFYWIFVAIYGLADQMNAYCVRYGVAAPKVSRTLAMWVCITSLLGWLPYIGIPVFFANLILHIILFGQFNETACAVIQHARRGGGRGAVPDPIPYQAV
jgi:hypothetical protein